MPRQTSSKLLLSRTKSARTNNPFPKLWLTQKRTDVVHITLIFILIKIMLKRITFLLLFVVTTGIAFGQFTPKLATSPDGKYLYMTVTNYPPRHTHRSH